MGVHLGSALITLLRQQPSLQPGPISATSQLMVCSFILIRRGTSGFVQKALDMRTGQAVAVKLLPRGPGAQSFDAQHITRELLNHRMVSSQLHTDLLHYHTGQVQPGMWPGALLQQHVLYLLFTSRGGGHSACTMPTVDLAVCRSVATPTSCSCWRCFRRSTTSPS
jgi:hypothetical protein